MNPLFTALTGQQANSNPEMDALRSDPIGTLRKAGFNVPDDMAYDPKATVIYLLQTGQINTPMMQRIRPMLNRMGIR